MFVILCAFEARAKPACVGCLVQVNFASGIEYWCCAASAVVLIAYHVPRSGFSGPADAVCAHCMILLHRCSHQQPGSNVHNALSWHLHMGLIKLAFRLYSGMVPSGVVSGAAISPRKSNKEGAGQLLLAIAERVLEERECCILVLKLT